MLGAALCASACGFFFGVGAREALVGNGSSMLGRCSGDIKRLVLSWRVRSESVVISSSWIGTVSDRRSVNVHGDLRALGESRLMY